MGDRYDDAAERINNGTGTADDRKLLQDNWGNTPRALSVKAQKYQDAVAKYDKK